MELLSQLTFDGHPVLSGGTIGCVIGLLVSLCIWIRDKFKSENLILYLLRYALPDEFSFDVEVVKNKIIEVMDEKQTSLKTLKARVKAGIEDLKNLTPVSVVLAFLAILVTLMTGVLDTQSTDGQLFYGLLIGIIYALVIMFGFRIVIDIKNLRKTVILLEMVEDIERDRQKEEAKQEQLKKENNENAEMKLAIAHLQFLVDTYLTDKSKSNASHDKSKSTSETSAFRRTREPRQNGVKRKNE